MKHTLLTKEQWLAVTPPFSFIKVKNPVWKTVHRDMIVKWLETHCGAGWVYWDGAETYIFQSPGDQLMFKMWIKDDPFSDDKEEGEILG